ncbi:hypothetical protein [Nocardia sp. NPDC019395]|uniref:hypothetical protein n=1 Tax=Nocardia sp. NPDC019395 TaxID=3154686 RepID=UPI0033C35123
MTSGALALIYRQVSGELASIFKIESQGYRHHTNAVSNCLRNVPAKLDEVGIPWTRDLLAADKPGSVAIPSDRAHELFERMRSFRRSRGAAVYWHSLDDSLSPQDLETLRLLTAINRKLDAIATERGSSPALLRAEITARLRRLVNAKPVVIRVNPATLAAVLRDGRFKTKFETGKSAGGAGLEGRAWLERVWFGHDPDTFPDRERPVYGSVQLNGDYAAATGPHGIGWFERLGDSEWKQGIGDADTLSAYGEIQVILKPDVLDRTTFTVGDSFNDRAATFPSHISNPQPESFYAYDNSTDGSAYKSPATNALGSFDRQYDLPSVTNWTYVEAQVHGGVRVNDIDHVLLPHDPAPELRQALDDNNVPWRVFNNETIAREGTPAERTAARERVERHLSWLDSQIEQHRQKAVAEVADTPANPGIRAEAERHDPTEGAGPNPGVDPDLETAYKRRETLERELEMLSRPRGDTGTAPTA